MRALALASSGFVLFVLGCASNPQPCADVPTAETSPPSEVASSPPEAPPEAAEAPAPPPAPAAEAPKPEPAPAPKPAEKPAAPEPQFTDGMSVADAIKAVPVGSERANIDQETLSVPIKDFAVYEPCKPGDAHIKMKVAIWDGKAVGIDVTTTPKNDKLGACIKDQIRSLTWKAHVKSLNTVEYSF